MDEIILGRFKQLRVGEALTYQGLTIFPLVGARHGAVDYALLADAVAAGLVNVAELEDATINTLIAINHGGLPVLVLDGEELIGGNQNRMVNSSVLLPPGRTKLPVTCVEHGRWRESGMAFSSPETTYPSLRRAKSAQVGIALHARGVHSADQGQVWSEIGARQASEGINSDTGAMADLYASRRDRLAAFEEALPYPDGAVGMIVALGGGVVSLDLFDAPGTARALWGKLVRAAALDTLAQPAGASVSHDRAVRMLRRVREAQFASFRSPGLGVDVRINGGGVIGSALIHEGAVIHAALFRQHQREGGNRIASQSTRRSLRTS